MLKETIRRLTQQVSQTNQEASGLQTGSDKLKTIQIATSLLKNNVDMSIIQEATGLSREELVLLSTTGKEQAIDPNASPAKTEIVVKRRGRKKKVLQ